MKRQLAAPPSELHVGIFGPSRCGKTTLAKRLSRAYWERHGIRSIVLDLNGESWGEHCKVFQNAADFERLVWTEKGCAVFMDDGSETIKRDNAKTPLFTRIRHRGHKLHVMGHSGINLLPEQREQISTLYLFRQRPRGAELWVEMFCDERLFQSLTLARYQFLECHIWGPVVPRVLSLKN